MSLHIGARRNIRKFSEMNKNIVSVTLQLLCLKIGHENHAQKTFQIKDVKRRALVVKKSQRKLFSGMNQKHLSFCRIFKSTSTKRFSVVEKRNNNKKIFNVMAKLVLQKSSIKIFSLSYYIFFFKL
jgi:hypothetical protein